jgi:hypothetical protein
MQYNVLTGVMAKLHNHLNKCSKGLDNFQHPFLVKALMKLGIEGMYLNIIKAIYDKHITNIILHEANLKPFPLK